MASFKQALADSKLLSVALRTSTFIGIPVQLYYLVRLEELIPTTTITQRLDNLLGQPAVSVPLVIVTGYLTVCMLYYWATTTRRFSARVGWFIPIMMGPIGTVPYYYVAYKPEQEVEKDTFIRGG